MGIHHIVGSGQTLYSISKVYGIEMRELMRINNIKDPSRIGVGERLFIPRASIPSQRLRRENMKDRIKDPNKLKVGQKIIIPVE